MGYVMEQTYVFFPFQSGFLYITLAGSGENVYV
jgi:hypothetical protein